jgi:uncharacterized protein
MSNTSSPTPRPFNAINWFEIPTRDMDRAVAFYQTTVGRTLRREVFGGLPHAVFPSQCAPGADLSVAGALVSGPHLTPGTSGAVIYLDCPDGVAASLARATAGGAIVDDPEGNRIGLHAMRP